MADGTAIEWSDATWNIVTGCSVKSPGCTNCYAMRLAGTRMKHHPSRTGLTRDSNAGPVWTGEVRFNEQWLDQPLHWTRPRKIFVCAHGDLFHEAVPNEWIDRVFAVMGLRPWHVFQLLTKRPERMRAWFEQGLLKSRIAARLSELNPSFDFTAFQWPLPNVWLGTSVEDQARADERIPHLLATPAAVRWLSCEPLLEEVLFDPCVLARIDWLVAGGESGPGARPLHPDWARSLRDQCAAAGVPFLFKQWGEWAPVCEMSEEAIDACYHLAPERDPEATRRRKVDQLVLHADGQRFDGRAMFERPAFEQGSCAMTMMAIGKARAGRMLDGVLHDAMPEVR